MFIAVLSLYSQLIFIALNLFLATPSKAFGLKKWNANLNRFWPYLPYTTIGWQIDGSSAILSD